MAVHEEVAFAGHFDDEFLLDVRADHGADDVVGGFVVVAFDPVDADAAAGAGEAAEVVDEAEVMFPEPRKIQVFKEVAEDDEATEGVPFLEGFAEFLRAGDFAAEVDVGDDEGVRAEGAVRHAEADFVRRPEGLLLAEGYDDLLTRGLWRAAEESQAGFDRGGKAHTERARNWFR